MKKPFSRILALCLVGLVIGSISGTAFASEGFAQRHPRRAEVLGRTRSLAGQIREDKGQLGGNYKQLMSTDKSIRQQEQQDAKQNGGYLTTAEKQQLNQEENSLRSQIQQDDKGF